MQEGFGGESSVACKSLRTGARDCGNAAADDLADDVVLAVRDESNKLPESGGGKPTETRKVVSLRIDWLLP